MEQKDHPNPQTKHRLDMGKAATNRVKLLSVNKGDPIPAPYFSKKLLSSSIGGTTHISDDAVASIAGIATSEIEGVSEVGLSSLRRRISEKLGGKERTTRGVEVSAGDKEVTLDITVKLIYGYSIPTTIVEIRNNVADKLFRYCNIVSKEINVRVAALDFSNYPTSRVE